MNLCPFVVQKSETDYMTMKWYACGLNFECIGCGNCIDSCPILRREPDRRDRTIQRTSMALEILVAEDCEQCYACALSCPQVDTAIKDYVVEDRVVEVIPQLRKIKFLSSKMLYTI